MFRFKLDEEENGTRPIPATNQADTDPLTEPPPMTDEASLTDHLSSQMDGKKEKTNQIKSKGKKNKKESKSVRWRIELMHCDIIKDEFWDARPDLLCI